MVLSVKVWHRPGARLPHTSLAGGFTSLYSGDTFEDTNPDRVKQ